MSSHGLFFATRLMRSRHGDTCDSGYFNEANSGHDDVRSHDALRDGRATKLEADGYDCLVFHATGAGGRAMENLVRSGLINGVLDITTTEVADEVVGGVFPAGPHRFEVLIEKQIPLLLSLGAVDMVNFGAKSTVPKEFRERRLHVHNEQVTLMRTTPDENRQIARWIANKLNQSTSPVTFVVPEGGVSAIDAPGQPFYDPDANAALFDELRNALNQTTERRLVFSPLHINDPKFAELLLSEYKAMERQAEIDNASERSFRHGLQWLDLSPLVDGSIHGFVRRANKCGARSTPFEFTVVQRPLTKRVRMD